MKVNRYLFPEHPNAIYHKVIADDTEYTFEKGAQTWCASWAQGIYKQLSIPKSERNLHNRPMTIVSKQRIMGFYSGC